MIVPNISSLLSVFLILIVVDLINSTQQYALCQGRGYRGADGLCVCSGRYYGSNCEYSHCPFGPSWLAVPTEHNTRNQPSTECSDMGHCDMLTGACKCREGYEGAACERIGCPTSFDTATYTTLPSGLYTTQAGDGLSFVDSAGVPLGVPTIPRGAVCSGHGICRTLREAGQGFDGLRLQRPPVDYDNWDADRISGCLCDPGYTGVACETRQCPFGLDPLDQASFYAKKETYVLQCRANSGFFALQLLGRVSEPIPWDADPATLRALLQQTLRGASTKQFVLDEVTVQMATNNATGLATVCRADAVAETQLTVSRSPGPLPPMRVLRATANTRRWPRGADRLRLHNSEDAAVLQMASQHWLVCPACGFSEHCHQAQLHLRYLDELTPAVNVSARDAARALQSAVWGLLSLRRAGYRGLRVNVTVFDSATGEPTDAGDARLCREEADTTTLISLLADFGNVHPALQLVAAGDGRRLRALNLTLSDRTGNGTLLECSGQGTCDRNVGLCKCLAQFDPDARVTDFATVSSNGLRDAGASVGSRGDCGFVQQRPQTCVSATSLASRLADQRPCSGHGTCVANNNDGDGDGARCDCFAGFLGVDCSLRQCARGRAFFDEPLFNDTAHRADRECSGNGDCDRRSGLCRCRAGFGGAACDVKDCARDPQSGEPCSGRGRCLSTRSFFGLFGLQYGNLTFAYSDAALLAASHGWSATTTNNGNGGVSLEQLRNRQTAASLAGGSWDADLWFECVCAASLPPSDRPSRATDPQRPVTGPRREVSGYSYGSRPLPGFTSFDCSQRRCPLGDAAAATSPGRATRLEVQKLLCTWRAEYLPYSLDRFTLQMPGSAERSLPIAYNATSAEIARAISFMPSVGNVSVAFFFTGDYDDASADYVACSHSYNDTFGGFLVRFETEPGALPLLTVVESEFFGGNVSVSRLQAGDSSAEECGGPTRGFCNRRTGQCLCNRGFSSSSGTGNFPGSRGDCAHFSGESEAYDALDDPFRRFYGRDAAGDRLNGVNGRDSRRAKAMRELEGH